MRTADGAAWHVLPIERDEPRALLDRGLALFDGLADGTPPTLRWYTATRTAIVLGRGQRGLTLPGASSVTVLERSSGGGSVLLDTHVLSLDVLLPRRHPWLDGDLGGVFASVGRAWADALGSLGVDGLTVHDGPSTTPRARDADDRSRLIAAVCFASVGRGEVLAGGRKLVGLAQRRRRHGALVQCGLLLRWDPGPLLSALGADPDDPEVCRAAVGLEELLGDPPSETAVRSAVEQAFERHLIGGITPEHDD